MHRAVLQDDNLACSSLITYSTSSSIATLGYERLLLAQTMHGNECNKITASWLQICHLCHGRLRLHRDSCIDACTVWLLYGTAG